MSKQTAATLKKTLDIIEKDGWCQGTYHNDDGRHCLAGAIGLAGRSSTKIHLAKEALRKFTTPYNVVGFNDKSRQCKRNIINLLKKGIRSQQQLP